MKASIQQRLEDDLARHAIEKGPTAWRSDRGSIAGSLLRSADLTDGPATLGIPEAVLAILDYIGGHIYFGRVSSPDLARSFVDAVRPGADLAKVAKALTDRLADLIDPNALSSDDSHDDIVKLAAMYRAGPTSPATVTAFIDQWLHVRSREAARAMGWTDDRENAAQETLNRLWDETAEARIAGLEVDYPLLFEEHDPLLAKGYVEALNLSNASYEADTPLIAQWFIDVVRAA